MRWSVARGVAHNLGEVIQVGVFCTSLQQAPRQLGDRQGFGPWIGEEWPETARAKCRSPGMFGPGVRGRASLSGARERQRYFTVIPGSGLSRS